MVIESLLSHLKPEGGDQTTIVYFYCDRAELNRRDPIEIMRSLIKQLSVIQFPEPHCAESVIDAYKKRDQNGDLDFRECCELLIKLLNEYSKTIIVIDALDEIDPTERVTTDFLNKLKKVMDSSCSVVKLFLSSRDDGDIVIQLSGVPSIFIDPEDSSSDIKRFIERELERRPLLNGKASSELIGKVKSSLLRQAGGM